MIKRALITGITGYIGSNLAHALLPSCEVYGLVREPLNLTYLSDIQEKVRFLFYDGTFESVSAALNVSRPDLVYHLAAYYTGAHGPQQTPQLVSSNITLGAYLLEAMSNCGCSALVYASTAMAHYQGEAYRPLNLYAATKQAFSDLLLYYTDTELLRAVTLVLSDTYGPGDQRPKILNLVKNAAQTGEKLELTDGMQDYDVVYIDDVVWAFQLAGKQLLEKSNWKNEIFQVVPQEPLTLRQTVEQLLAVNALTMDAIWGARPRLEREMCRAIRRYPVLPGWRPQTALCDGLRRFVQQSR